MKVDVTNKLEASKLDAWAEAPKSLSNLNSPPTSSAKCAHALPTYRQADEPH